MKRLVILKFLFCFCICALINIVKAESVNVIEVQDKSNKSHQVNEGNYKLSKVKRSIFFGGFLGSEILHNSKFSVDNWRGLFMDGASTRIVGANYREAIAVRNNSHFAPGIELGFSERKYKSFVNFLFSAFLSDYEASNHVPEGIAREIRGNNFLIDRFVKRSEISIIDPTTDIVREYLNQSSDIPNFTGKVNSKVGFNFASNLEIGHFLHPRIAVFLTAGAHLQKFKDNGESLQAFGFNGGFGVICLMADKISIKMSAIYKNCKKSKENGIKLRVSSYLITLGFRFFL